MSPTSRPSFLRHLAELPEALGRFVEPSRAGAAKGEKRRRRQLRLSPQRLEDRVVLAGTDAFSSATNAPTVVSTTPAAGASLTAGFSSMTVTFNERVTTATAQNVANYLLSGPSGAIRVTGAVLDESGTVVTLSFSSQAGGGEYSLRAVAFQTLPASSRQMFTPISRRTCTRPRSEAQDEA